MYSSVRVSSVSKFIRYYSIFFRLAKKKQAGKPIYLCLIAIYYTWPLPELRTI